MSSHRGEGSSFTLVRKIGQACTIFNFQLSILIYSYDLLITIGPAATWSVPPPLNHISTDL